MGKPRVDSPTGYYHVIQRGTGKQILFEDQRDYIRYLDKLVKCRDELDFVIGAYCLMANHTHMLLRGDSAVLAKLFLRLGTSYSRYYNTKYEHVGHVFQGRYLSEPIIDEAYLRACIRYIHNNPVKAGYGKRDEYQWSSYNEFINGDGITNVSDILDILGGVDAFRELCASKDNELDDEFLDYNRIARRHDKGLRIIRQELGYDCKNGLVVQSLDKSTRNRIILQLKMSGLSQKNIELLTGVSRSIVRRIGFDD